MFHFLFLSWGLLFVAHVVGWIAFQPAMTRAVARNARVNCPRGNSIKHCNEFHGPACRETPVKGNIDGEDFWSGVGLAFVWEITALFYFMYRRANQPDKLQTHETQLADQAEVDRFEETRARILEFQETKALKARTPDEDGIAEADLAEDDVAPGLTLAETAAMIREEERKQLYDSYRRSPDWYRAARRSSY